MDEVSFFQKGIGNVACVVESVSGYITVNDKSIDLISYQSGETIGRIFPALVSSKSMVSDEYSFVRVPQDSKLCICALRHREEVFEVYVWDLTTCALIGSSSIEIEKKSLSKVFLMEYNVSSLRIVALSSKGLLINCLFDCENVNASSIKLTVSKSQSVFVKDKCQSGLVNFHQLSESSYVFVGSQEVYYIDFNASQYAFSKMDKKDIACVSVANKVKKIVALGTLRGRIYIFHNINMNPETWIKNLCHWHAHAVLSLHFSEDGNILYSGGYENVLVYWPLRDLKSNYFLPRLPSTIISINTMKNSEFILCAFGNNSVGIISASNKLVTLFEMFKKESGLVDCTNLVSHANLTVYRNQVVTVSQPGKLQFCQAESGKTTMEVDISDFNYVSGTKTNEVLPQWRVVAFDINTAGYICTLEHCRTDSVEQAILKFWSFIEHSILTLQQIVTAVKLGRVSNQVISRARHNEFIISTDFLYWWKCSEGKFSMAKVIDPRPSKIANRLSCSFDGSLILGNCSSFIQFWNCEKFEPHVQLSVDKVCIEALFGMHSLTAKYLLLAFEDEFQIQNITGEIVFRQESFITNIRAVGSCPAFVAFNPLKRSVCVVFGKLLKISQPLSFEVYEFVFHSNHSCVYPLMVPKDKTSCGDTLVDSELPTWFANNSLVAITEKLEYFVLQNRALQTSFSYLQSAHFLREAAEFELNWAEAMKSPHGSSVLDKLSAVKLNKFVQEGLDQYSSHLLPNVGDITRTIFSLALPQTKHATSSLATNNDHLELPTKSREDFLGDEVGEDMEVDYTNSKGVISQNISHDQDQFVKVKLLVEPVVQNCFAFLDGIESF